MAQRANARVAARKPEPSSADPRSAFEVLMPQVLRFFLAAGYGREQLAQELSSWGEELRGGAPFEARKASARHYAMMMQAGRVLHDWCNDPHYVGTDGKPMLLPLRGAGANVSALLKRHFPRASLRVVLQWMEEEQFIVHQQDGRYEMRSRAALMHKPNIYTTERSATLAGHILETAMHNARTRDKRNTNFDRAAQVSRISVRDLNRFRQFLNVQGQSFLEIIDDWLESHTAPEGEKAVAEASVHLYLHTHQPTLSTRRRLRR